MKRLLDLTIAGMVLVFAAPVMAVTGAAIRLSSGRPVLFRQWRSGRGGVPFLIAKLRTMRSQRPGETGPDTDIARTTRLGRWLRTFSLDELPTLVHVLRGQMSLVGPRPLPVEYLDRYDDEQARRLEVRPGITGWAQVNGRNATTWDERLAHDVWYVDHRSLRLDLRILVLTARQVLTRQGVDHAPGVTMTEFRGPGS